MNKILHTLVFKIPDRLYQKLRERAYKESLPMAEIVRRALKAYLG